ncbi:MAG: DUF4959 domain-containing protein [Prevotellaceae bacterium]|jgi:hypothetical protein|nr:DUF4959 domain-containing protein [Prevotellaceae bacterium]
MKRKIFIFIMIAALMYISGCSEEGRIDHFDDSAPAPAPVTGVQVENTPGGAVISYNIPNDKNLLGVKVVYTRNGEVCESKTSKFMNYLVVEGFGSTASQEVQLYSVGINEKLSEPVPVSINPLVPSVQTVTFDLEVAFGGVVASLEENVSTANLSLVLLMDTLYSAGEKRQWVQVQAFYTESVARRFTQRGLDSKAIDFALYVRDRWGNTSDTIYRTLTPLEEVKLSKEKFANMKLPSDFYLSAENDSYPLENMWSGNESSDHTIYASEMRAPRPSWVTIDFGYTAAISRIQMLPRPDYELYSGSAPRTFELWGSTNPNLDGSWDESWTLLGEFEQFKPSGYGEELEVGPITDEDKDYWYNRTEFELTRTENVPNPYMPVRYIRLKFTSSFTTYGTEAVQGQIIISELTFWGQLIEED